MPQIAQQDYLYIKPVNANVVANDAAALGQLRGAIDKGTIWDCIIFFPCDNEGEDYPNISKVLSYNPDKITIYDNSADKTAIINVPYTQQQYEVLAAIQRESISNGYDEPSTIRLPALSLSGSDRDTLTDSNTGCYICVDSHILKGIKKDSYLDSLTLGEQISELQDYINITWEDAQKLIGLPINQ